MLAEFEAAKTNVPSNFKGCYSTPHVWIESKQKVDSKDDVFEKDIKVGIKTSEDELELCHCCSIWIKIEDNDLKTNKIEPTKKF